MIIKQGKSNVDFDKPCPARSNGIHMWYFRPNEWGCGNCGWKIPIARLVCEHCGEVNKFARADLVPNPLGLVDIFECVRCGKNSAIQNELQ
jgi:hypothetical protein